MFSVTKVGSEFLFDTQTASGQAGPTITSLSNDSLVASWSNDSGIVAQVFDATGGKVGSEFLVSTQTAGNQAGPTITGLSNGGFVVSWSAEAFAIKAQVFDASGGKVGSEFLVNALDWLTGDAVFDPTITRLSNGGFVVTWFNYHDATFGHTSVYSQKAQVFSASGGKVGSEVLINSQTVFIQYPQAITSLSNGGIVASWFNDSGIVAQVFDATGGKVGSEFLVSTQIAGNQSGPTITGLSNGGFVVSWSSGYDAIKAQVFDASGGKVGSEFLVNTHTAGGYPTITGLPNGGFVVSWSNDSGIEAQVFDTSGAKVGSEFLVHTQTAGGYPESPTITGLSSGDFVISWTNYIGRLGDASALGFKAQIFSVGAVAPTLESGPQSQVVVEAGSGTAGTSTATIELTALDAGGWVFSTTDWTSIDATHLSKTGTYGSVVLDTASGLLTYTLDNGRFATEVLAAAVTATDSFDVAVTDLTGQVVTKSIGFEIAGSADDAPVNVEAKVGGEFLVTTEAGNLGYDQTIAGLQNGGFVVSWMDYSGTLGDASGWSIKAQVFDALGGKVGTEFLVNTQTEGHQSFPTITGLANGGFVVSWMDSGTLVDATTYPSVRAQVFDGAGGPVGTEIVVNTQTESAGYPTITGLSDGGFVVSWSGYGGIRAQFFDASGGKLGTEFFLNRQMASSSDLRITALSNGGFVVSWTDSSGTLGDADGASIKAQVFDASGSPMYTGVVLVNTQTLSDQYGPTITGLSNGGFVISWTDRSGTLGDASDESVKAQVFDVWGNKIGFEILVNMQTLSYQFEPTITGLANGGFVVSWVDESGRGFDSGIGGPIKAQVFDAAGSRVGTEFTVNALSDDWDNSERRPTVTGLPSGGFVVSWTGSGGIKAQIFSIGDKTPHYDASGNLIGETFIHGGVREETSYGVAGHSYASETLIYDQASGALKETQRFYDDAQRQPASNQVLNSDGTSTATYWTPAGIKSVFKLDAAGQKTQRDSYDSAGRHTLAQIFKADGSGVSQRFHVGTGKVISQTITDTSGKVVEIDSYSNAGVQTKSEKFLADGSRTVDIFNAAGAPINETLFRTDGTKMVTAYYAAGSRYADSMTEYDASHRMTSKSYHYADAARTLAKEQTFGADGSGETLTYDTSGRLTLDTAIAADGSKGVTQETYAGSATTPETILFTQYDAGGARQWTDLTKADGSHAQRSLTAGVTLTSHDGVADAFTGFAGGTDTFVFTDKTFGKDTVTGFTAGSGAGHDVLQFSAAVAADFATLQTLMTKSGKDTLITIDAGNSVLLKNVAPTMLVAADFSFVG